jgi:uncharacterized membrane protein
MGADVNAALQNLTDKLVNNLVNPLLALIFAVGFLVFIYGVLEFMWGLNQETEARQTGKWHMLYGVIGMAIMASAYAILNLIASMVCGGGLNACIK